jgi:hypothetical protein
MLATDAGSLVARDCRSNQGKAPAPARGGGQRKTAQARVFALTPGDAEASNDVVTGTLPLFSRRFVRFWSHPLFYIACICSVLCGESGAVGL